MKKVVLFDIDGTLVLTGRAGVRAMNRACQEIIGHTEALDGIPVAGRTDWIILHDTLERIGRQLDEGLFNQLRTRYLTYLRDEIVLPGTGFKGALPGVTGLLDMLQARSDVFLGLLTGNFEEGARIKLEHFDLWRYFRCGAFGDDAADRNVLVPIALARARASGLPEMQPHDVIVVGDTPHDVACALAVGATPVAVATGSFTAAELRTSGASLVLPTLETMDPWGQILN
jgi:phosphoglycolate phosphatase